MATQYMDRETLRPLYTSSRRGFLAGILLTFSLFLSYGLFGLFSWSFLRPRRDKKSIGKMFVTYIEELNEGGSFTFETPKGERFLLTRGKGMDLRAFSSRCPHLGCKVHWEAEKNHYVCPCHAGVFDPSGKATEGPPAKAGQNLKSCEIILDGRAIYAMVES